MAVAVVIMRIVVGCSGAVVSVAVVDGFVVAEAAHALVRLAAHRTGELF